MASVEEIKATSNGLRGTMPIQLLEPAPSFDDDVKQLLKFHGIYQQHNRDVRGRNNRQYYFMVRSKLPGGQLTPEQYLIHDALADEFSQGDLRLTTRQGIQLHGVIKHNLQGTLRSLNHVLVSTLGACGDVERNIMSCPATYGDPVRLQLQAIAERLAQHLAPRTTAYHEIWLEDEEGKKVRQSFESNGASAEVVEPIYGKTYLPRKFKTAIAFAGDNCTDILSNDVGMFGLVDEATQTVHGVNLYVGGGMGQTHNMSDTYPRLATPLGYVPVDRIVDVVEKVILVQRDFGNREDRRKARMKYLIDDWGEDVFRAKVEEYLGYELEDFRPMPPIEYHDHLGWHAQQDGRWFCGVYVENGRVRDTGTRFLRSGLRAVIQRYRPPVAITGQQNILLGGFTDSQRAEVDDILHSFGIATLDQLTEVRRHAMACPALPTCGLSLAEAERFLPSVIDDLEPMIAELGLESEAFSIRMTGCPNGCARPYIADIGIVGRSGDQYTLYLGGNMEGTRLNTLYRDLVRGSELPSAIYGVLAYYVDSRQPGERLTDWIHRLGVDAISAATAVAVY